MTYIINFLKDCKFGNAESQQFTYENRLTSNRPLEERFLSIEHNLFQLYKIISNSSLYFSYKQFHFLSYNQVYEQYREVNILIGKYYEGMGYSCALYYNREFDYYFFKIMGGSEGHSVNDTYTSFVNCDYSSLDKNKRFKTLRSVFQFITETVPEYEGDVCYFNHPNVIN